jgi:mannose-1-phosphate guanylyltransferase
MQGASEVKAILLSGGVGSRLMPLTAKIPKCLAQIDGEPILEIWLKNLSDIGIRNFLVNVSYLKNIVIDYLENCKYRQKVKIVEERELLGTGGTLINNLDFYEGEDGILLHVDNYFLGSLADLLAAHRARPKRCVMTMLTFRTENISRSGIVEIDQEDVLINFKEKPESSDSNLANGAIYILSKEMIIDLKGKYSRGTIIDFSSEIIPDYLNRIFTIETNETLLDIGTPETYKYANQIARAKNDI